MFIRGGAACGRPLAGRQCQRGGMGALAGEGVVVRGFRGRGQWGAASFLAAFFW